jgi:hypothetical protein
MHNNVTKMIETIKEIKKNHLNLNLYDENHLT